MLQVRDITSALQKIESAIVGQARGQVEDLLSKLGDAVSGGFVTESSRMKDVLTRFAEVVPQLEVQIRDMMTSAGRDMAQRGDSNARMNEALVQKLETVLSSIGAQQHVAAEISKRMEAFVLQTQTTLASALANADHQIMERSRLSLGELQGAMRSATDDAAQVYRRLVQDVESASLMLKEARVDASTGASDLRESARVMQEALVRMQDAVGGLQRLGTNLNEAVAHAHAAVNLGTTALQASSEAVAQQQRFVSELAGRWPEMTKLYLDSSDEAFAKVAASWKAQADAIGASVQKISNAFQGPANEFASAVDSLEEQLSRLLKERPASTESTRPRAE
jgi:hypothetical protein